MSVTGFSFGALAGAGLAAAAAAAGIGPLVHLASIALVGAVAAVCLAPGFLPDEGSSEVPKLVRPGRNLAALGAIAFCTLLAEGAVFDWSGIYLATETDAAARLAPLGLAAFSLCMGVGRLMGDRAAVMAGSAATARGGALFAAAGLGLALTFPNPLTAIAGFALMGIGLSAVFSLTLRASAFRAEVTGPALAAVSTVGYAGFLTGPPVIGLIADVTGLRSALILVCGLCLVAATLATSIRR